MDEKYLDLHKELRSRVEGIEAKQLKQDKLDFAIMSEQEAMPESSYLFDKKLIAEYRARIREIESRIAKRRSSMQRAEHIKRYRKCTEKKSRG